jgi:hypothetical protein
VTNEGSRRGSLGELPRVKFSGYIALQIGYVWLSIEACRGFPVRGPPPEVTVRRCPSGAVIGALQGTSHRHISDDLAGIPRAQDWVSPRTGPLSAQVASGEKIVR